jgi:hypothetical protein
MQEEAHDNTFGLDPWTDQAPDYFEVDETHAIFGTGPRSGGKTDATRISTDIWAWMNNSCDPSHQHMTAEDDDLSTSGGTLFDTLSFAVRQAAGESLLIAKAAAYLL